MHVAVQSKDLMRKPLLRRGVVHTAIAWSATCSLRAELTNSLANSSGLSSVAAPELGLSLVRVFGAFFLVIALFLGGVWLFRNWQRFAGQRNGTPKLNVLEVRSLGGRQALYVVGYERERYLLSASPQGVNLVTHLPTGEEAAPVVAEASPPALEFGRVLSQRLRGGK